MKIDYNKVFAKTTRDSTPVKVEDLLIDGVKLGDIIARVERLNEAYDNLCEELKDAYIVKKDTAYIVEIDKELKQVNELKLFEATKLKLPLKYYKVENGQLVPDKKKVGKIL